MFWKVLLLAVALLGTSSVEARSIVRSGPFGNVNLVEVNVRGTTYGMCSFVRDRQEIQVIFEERGDDMKASATNPTILDPVAETRQCKEAAMKSPDPEPAFRSALDSQTEQESPESIQMRLFDLQAKIASNENYITQLAPRIFPFPFSGTSANNLLLTLGSNSATNTNANSFSLNLPTNTHSSSTFGLAFPNLTSLFGSGFGK